MHLRPCANAKNANNNGRVLGAGIVKLAAPDLRLPFD
jgi:hypothetical protein